MSYQLDEYARMLVEPVRAGAYFAALRETVRPGMVVADIGAGPGVLGVYAATLGARRVFLVEPDASVNVAPALARENGVGDRVEVIRAPSTEISLPEQADVIVSDLRGILPFHGHHLAAALDMRRRHLAPGGICIPQRDVVMTALVEDAPLHARTVGSWSRLPVALTHDTLARPLANRWYGARAEGAQLLSDPARFVTLDYDQPTPPLAASWEAEARRDGVVHGLLAWFDTVLTGDISFSNAPTAPKALYGQGFFPFTPELPVRKGERIQLELRAVQSGDDYAWIWAATTAGGDTVRHSTLHGLPLHADALAVRSERTVARRSEEAELQLAILQLANGERTLGDIATALHERFGARFPSQQSALNHLTALDRLWAR